MNNSLIVSSVIVSIASVVCIALGAKMYSMKNNLDSQNSQIQSLKSKIDKKPRPQLVEAGFQTNDVISLFEEQINGLKGQLSESEEIIAHLNDELLGANIKIQDMQDMINQQLNQNPQLIEDRELRRQQDFLFQEAEFEHRINELTNRNLELQRQNQELADRFREEQDQLNSEIHNLNLKVTTCENFINDLNIQGKNGPISGQDIMARLNRQLDHLIEINRNLEERIHELESRLNHQ